jgi:hypothetical protein
MTACWHRAVPGSATAAAAAAAAAVTTFCHYVRKDLLRVVALQQCSALVMKWVAHTQSRLGGGMKEAAASSRTACSVVPGLHAKVVCMVYVGLQKSRWFWRFRWFRWFQWFQRLKWFRSGLNGFRG